MNYIHNTAIIDCDKNNIGDDTKIWAYSHICKNVKIGKNCIIGEGVYIGPNVIIGDNCKIQNHSLIYEGVELENDVFIGPNVITTNDIFPRSIGNWNDRFRKTLIKNGASICANSTIVCGIIIGENAMIGAGSVVTKNIKSNYLAYGNPARHARSLMVNQ
jgi:UDP-2-acetamido-3-amino-2,3-dideoxy-glucuronate N-acetyltransferase